MEWASPELDGTYIKLRSRVLLEVGPSEDEKNRIRGAASSLLGEAGRAAHEVHGAGIEPLLVGSVAKGTMTKRPDIDVFLLFPGDTPAEVLREEGLKIGSRVLEDPRKRYTQHPYLTGRYRGFNADIVPCLRIERGEKVKTAVDRTPHHTEYVNSRMDDHGREEVLLLKSFLKGIGAYGAEETSRGFSGYLVELMVLRFGGFPGFLSYLSRIDPAEHPPGGSEEVNVDHEPKGRLAPVLFDEPPLLMETPSKDTNYKKLFRNDRFIVIDPVDPNRNVASPVSAQTLAYSSKAASEFLRNPSESYFSHRSSRPRRASHDDMPVRKEGRLGLFQLEVPDVEPGVFLAQLRSNLKKAAANLERTGFEKLGFRYLVSFSPDSEIDGAYLRCRHVWELPVDNPTAFISLFSAPERLPGSYIHIGPPADNRHAENFRSKWGKRVFEIDGKLAVELQRDVTDPDALFSDVWEASRHSSSLEDIPLLSLSPVDPLYRTVLPLITGECDTWLDGGPGED